VPEDQRPPQEPLLADYNPWEKLLRTPVDARRLSSLLCDPKAVLIKVLAGTPRCLISDSVGSVTGRRLEGRLECTRNTPLTVTEPRSGHAARQLATVVTVTGELDDANLDRVSQYTKRFVLKEKPRRAGSRWGEFRYSTNHFAAVRVGRRLHLRGGRLVASREPIGSPAPCAHSTTG